MKKHKLVIKHIFVFIFSFLTLVSNATNYYADPVNGSMTNTGSYNSPWAGLSNVFTANKTFLAGDTIFLRTGDHGTVTIKGNNTGFVVITPQPNESPVIDRIKISDASLGIVANYWKLYKLFVQSEATGLNATPSYPLIEVFSYATNITISECTVTSNLNTGNWTRDDWRNKCNNGIHTRGKLNSNYIIENNLIKNTAFSLSVSSSNTIVRGNIVQNFTNDGGRIIGSNVLFENNKILDLIKVMAVSENHDDLLQGFTVKSGGTGQDTLKNVIVRGNTLITCTDTTRQFRGSSQGLVFLDGPFLNCKFENNVVLVDHWHGISVYGGINCRVVNNTVLDPYLYTPYYDYDNNSTTTGPAWISINQKSTSIPSSGNVVKNNIVHYGVTIAGNSMGTASNNLTVSSIGNFSRYFVDVSNLAYPGNFNLHLRSGNPAIGNADGTYAPTTDLDGITRPQGGTYDIGAYEYVVATTGLAETEYNSVIKIFPNPFKNELYLESKFNFGQDCQIQLFDIKGQLVYESLQNLTSSNIQLRLNSDISDGIMLLRIKSSTGEIIYSRKIVKIN